MTSLQTLDTDFINCRSDWRVTRERCKSSISSARSKFQSVHSNTHLILNSASRNFRRCPKSISRHLYARTFRSFVLLLRRVSLSNKSLAQSRKSKNSCYPTNYVPYYHTTYSCRKRKRCRLTMYKNTAGRDLSRFLRCLNSPVT